MNFSGWRQTIEVPENQEPTVDVYITLAHDLTQSNIEFFAVEYGK